MFFIFAYLSFFHAQAMVDAPLGRSLVLLIALFWLLRALEQIVFFGLRHAVSIALFVAFLIGTALYGYAYLRAVPWL